MKKLILLFLLVSYLSNYAQEENYMPLLNKTGIQKWKERYEYRWDHSIIHYADATIICSDAINDTVIDGLVYKKLFINECEVKDDDSTITQYYRYIREENKKIFEYQENSITLLYDFSLNVGDTFKMLPTESFIIYTITKIDTIEINGQLRRQFEVGMEGRSSHAYWIEGTGGKYGLLGSLGATIMTSPNTLSTTLGCHLHNDEILYNWANRCNNLLDIDEIISNANNLSPKISVFPNPATNFINVNISPYIENNYVFNLFDIQGNKIIEQPLVTNNQLIATKNLNEGSYIYTITLNNNIIQKNILIIAK